MNKITLLCIALVLAGVQVLGQTAPSKQVDDIDENSIGITTADYDADNDVGTHSVAFIKQTSSETDVPVVSDNTVYSANATYGSGDQLGTSGWYCVYNDADTRPDVVIDGLTEGSDYRIVWYAYNDDLGGNLNYLSYVVNGENAANFTTVEPDIAPTTQARDIDQSHLSLTSVEYDVNDGDGTHRLAFVKQTSSTADAPSVSNGSSYSASATFGAGTDDGNGWYCVYNGTNDNVSIDGLSEDTDYRIVWYEYNTDGASRYTYLTELVENENAANFTTPNPEVIPTIQMSDIDQRELGALNAEYRADAGNGTNQIVFIKQTSSTTDAPAIYDDSTYTAHSAYGNGDDDGNGWYCVYNGSSHSPNVNVSNLTAATDYRIVFMEYNSDGAIRHTYNTSISNGVNAANFTTIDPTVAPTEQASNINIYDMGLTTVKTRISDGNGTHRLAFIKETGSTVEAPVVADNMDYNDNDTYGSGDDDGNGWFCVSNGTGGYESIDGLSPATTYRIVWYEYVSDGAGTLTYYTTVTNGENAGNFTTIDPAAAPTTQSYNIVQSDLGPTTAEYAVTEGSGTHRLAFVKQTSSASGFPTVSNGTTYADDPTFGNGDNDGSDWFCVYNGTSRRADIDGLTEGTDYRIVWYEYNSDGASEYNYYTTVTNGMNAENFTTNDPATAPTTQSYDITERGLGLNYSSHEIEEGNGTHRLAFIKQTSSTTDAPAVSDNTQYLASETYGNGSDDGNGWYCVYNYDESWTRIEVDGLTEGTDYRIVCIEYNNDLVSTFTYYTSVTNGENAVNFTTIDPDAAPTTQAYDINQDDIDTTSATYEVTAGNGTHRLAFVKQTSSVSDAPAVVDDTYYTANSSYGSGDDDGNGWYCVYNGTSTFPNADIDGLSPATEYRIVFYEYNSDESANHSYYTSVTNGVNAENFVTEFNNATNVSFSNTGAMQTGISWTRGGGDYCAVFAYQGSTGNASPSDGNTYAADASFGSGDQLGSSGWFCIYNGTGSSVTMTNLSGSTDYRVEVIEYTNALGTIYSILSGTGNPATVTTTGCTPTADAGADTTYTCPGASISLTASGGVLYDWSGGITQSTAFTPTTDTKYYVTVGSGCGYDFDSVMVLLNEAPTITSESKSDISCYGLTDGELAFTATGGVGTLTYSIGSSNTTGTFTGLSANSYTLTVTDDSTCTAIGSTQTISQPAQLAANAGADQAVCAGESVTLNGTGAGSKAWSGGIIDGTAFTPTATMNYILTIGDGSCQTTDTVLVTVNALPTVALASSADSVESGSSATLTASGASTYAWSESGMSGATADVSPTASTTYMVTGTDANGCADTESITLVVTEAATDTTDNNDTTDTYVNSYDQVQLTLYPNPSSGKLYIESEDAVDKLEIYNQSTLVKAIAPVEGKELDLSELSAGVYYIRLYIGDEIITRKVSVIR